MNAKKPVPRRSLKSDLARVDDHKVRSKEYEELPELTDDMLVRAKVNKGGRPLSPNPRKLISLRLPADVIERWKSEEHTSELQSHSDLVCRLLLEKKKNKKG